MKKLIVLLLFALSGCTAIGPEYEKVAEVPENETVVYIYRDGSTPISARRAYFYINNINVFDLNKLGYSWVTLPEGEYELKQKWPFDVSIRSIKAPFSVSGSGERYLRFSVEMCRGGPMCFRWILEEVSPDIARYEITKTKYQENFGLTKLKKSL